MREVWNSFYWFKSQINVFIILFLLLYLLLLLLMLLIIMFGCGVLCLIPSLKSFELLLLTLPGCANGFRGGVEGDRR